MIGSLLDENGLQVGAGKILQGAIIAMIVKQTLSTNSPAPRNLAVNVDAVMTGRHACVSASEHGK